MSEAGKAVFLSYASQDTEAAKRICDALRAAGIEVWFDQSELVGGDQWDAKIRGQIGSCALFMPVVSASTQARREGYFRIEWRLAAQRTHGMADGTAFLMPVVIDATRDAEALVPAEFKNVQWTKLPGGETTAAFVGRVKKLLDGDVAGVADPGPASARPATGARSARMSKWWWALPVFGMTMAMFLLLKEGRHEPPPPPAPVATAPAKPAASAVSEVRQLVAKARAMSLDKYDSTAEDYAAAEGLLKRALALDQNDAETWIFSSLLNTSVRTRGFDHAPGRRTQAQRDAERALALAPNSTEALFALGRAQRDFDHEAAEQTFKRILEREPGHTGALGQLAWIYDYNGKVDEASALYEQVIAAEPKREALTRYTQFLLFFHYGRFAEAERSIRRSIAIQPSANSQAGLAMLLLTWKGDAEEAARVLTTGPTAARKEPRTIWNTALVQLCRREPEEVLKTLERLPDDYIQDNWFAGPKAYFAGRAHALAGRPEAARVAWESALAITNARLNDTPGSVELHVMRGQLLAFLGQAEEARREARTLGELQQDHSGYAPYWFDSPVLIYAALGRADDALPLLAKLLVHDGKTNLGWPLTPALLRLDPLWDKLRGDARFQKLLADAEAADIAALPARDWPKDPELKRAVSLLDRVDAIPEDFRLAEDITQRALDRAPADPETVTVMARVQSMWLLRGWDRSNERYLKAKAMAERALQLAPDEPEAYIALTIYLYTRGGELERARSIAERAVALAPGEPRAYRMRDNVLFFVPGMPRAEAFASAERTAALFPRDAVVHYELARHYRDYGRWAEFERETDVALALAPVANAMVWKARACYALHGDLAAMKAQLDQVPPRVRTIERTVFTYFIYAALSGHLEVGLDALDGMPEPWMVDFDLRGPKAMLTAELLHLQGKPALARLQYEVALAALKKRQVEEPTDIALRINEAWMLHGLGRDEEARAANRASNEGIERPYRLTPMTSWWFQPIACNLLLGERAFALDLIRETAGSAESRATIRQRMQLDPRMKTFRDDPEIKALLAEPEAKK